MIRLIRISEALEPIANKIGLSSIAVSVSASAVKSKAIAVVVDAPWVMTDYALLISMIGGVLFGLDKAVALYYKIINGQERRRKQRR